MVALDPFQQMVISTIQRSLGEEAETILVRICSEMGIALGALGPQHMAEFSQRLYDATEGLLEEHQRKFLAGTIAHFARSRVGPRPLAPQA